MPVNAFRLPQGEDDLAVRVYTGNAGVGCPAPVIVLCHGFCGIQTLLLPAVARRFAQAGFVVVTFDYRGFGESGGERGRLVPMQQLEDIRAVIRWARQDPVLDAQRIGLWGTSLGGAHAVVTAARESGVKCVVSQLSFACGETLLTDHLNKEEKAEMLRMLQQMRLNREASGEELWVPVNSVLQGGELTRFFESHRSVYPQSADKIPFLTVQELLDYWPVAVAGNVTQPTLVMAAERDTVNPPSQAYQLFEALGGEKAFQLLPGARHYDLYHGAHFNTAMTRQLAWFRHYL